jgi:hypothetical protein
MVYVTEEKVAGNIPGRVGGFHVEVKVTGRIKRL